MVRDQNVWEGDRRLTDLDMFDIRDFFPSLSAEGGYLFATGTTPDTATTWVIAADGSLRTVARNHLKGFYSSPVFVDRRAFVRTAGHVYCIESTSP
jgi:hypothetical protein